MVLCQARIETGLTTNTYCMREAGHTGEHNIVNAEPVKKKQVPDKEKDREHE